MINKADITKRIRILTMILAKDQSEFAKKINVPNSSMSYYLDGRLPSIDILARMVEVAKKQGEDGITLDWLVFGVNPPTISENLVHEPNLKYGESLFNIDKSGKKPLIQFTFSEKQLLVIKGITQLDDDDIDLVLGLVNNIITKKK